MTGVQNRVNAVEKPVARINIASIHISHEQANKFIETYAELLER
jgi:hypothetical protein